MGNSELLLGAQNFRFIDRKWKMHKLFIFFSCQQTISGGLIEESLTPPPAYAITIESGESLFVPPSYKMIFPSTYSYSQDSYGGLPDFSCFSAGTYRKPYENLWINCCITIEITVSDTEENVSFASPRNSLSSNSSESPLILTGGSVTPTSTPTTPTSRPSFIPRTSTSEYNLLRPTTLPPDERAIYEFDSQTGEWRAVTINMNRRGSQ